ncbi:MAG TPA: NDP-sugar synthase, partial [Actinomycetota bacterium]|nr:NDP-sugar synthase [Actinomycetota bacterium]
AHVPTGTMVSIERETFPALISDGSPLFATVAPGYWRDIGTPAAYLKAQSDALHGRVALPLAGPAVDPTASVATDARSEESVVGDGARIEEAASLSGSTVMAGARVARGASVERSILGPGSLVGEGASLRDSVLGEGAQVLPGSIAEGSRIPGPETRLSAG